MIQKLSLSLVMGWVFLWSFFFGGFPAASEADLLERQTGLEDKASVARGHWGPSQLLPAHLIMHTENVNTPATA